MIQPNFLGFRFTEVDSDTVLGAAICSQFLGGKDAWPEVLKIIREQAQDNFLMVSCMIGYANTKHIFGSMTVLKINSFAKDFAK